MENPQHSATAAYSHTFGQCYFSRHQHGYFNSCPFCDGAVGVEEGAASREILSTASLFPFLAPDFERDWNLIFEPLCCATFMANWAGSHADRLSKEDRVPKRVLPRCRYTGRGWRPLAARARAWQLYRRFQCSGSVKTAGPDAADSARTAGHVFGRQAPPFFRRGTKLLVPPSEFSNPVKAPTPDETVASSRLPVTLRALRNRNFQLFF